MCSGSTWPPGSPDRSSFQHTVIYENIRLFVCRVLKITRPVFLPPNYLSPISVHHSHYLSTESHSDINNPPLPPWKLNDALQLPRWPSVMPDLLPSQLDINLCQWKVRTHLPWLIRSCAVQFSDSILLRQDCGSVYFLMPQVPICFSWAVSCSGYKTDHARLVNTQPCKWTLVDKHANWLLPDSCRLHWFDWFLLIWSWSWTRLNCD